MNWSVRPDKRFRLALGSFVEEYNNKVRNVVLAILSAKAKDSNASELMLMLVTLRSTKASNHNECFVVYPSVTLKR